MEIKSGMKGLKYLFSLAQQARGKKGKKTDVTDVNKNVISYHNFISDNNIKMSLKLFSNLVSSE